MKIKAFLILLCLMAVMLTVCACKSECKHTAVTDAGTAATCIAEGRTDGEHCSACGEVITPQSAVAALGHDYQATVTTATCTESGFTTYTCTRCDSSYTDSEVEALGHSYSEESFAPTCAEEGYTLHSCTHDGCSESYRDNIIEVTAHRFENGSCLDCSMSAPTDAHTPDTEWYSADRMVFTLTTGEQLAGLASLVNGGESFAGKTVYLGCNIDLGYLVWTPIGDEGHVFSGTFNGNGYTVSNLYVPVASSYAGLFGKSVGAISDVTLNNVCIYTAEMCENIGSLCGYTTAAISGVTADGYVNAKNASHVGGIVGCTTAQLESVESGVCVTGKEYVGGITGSATAATAVYTKLVNRGAVTGGAYTAGIAGSLICSGTLFADLCENYGDINGKAYTSGLFGYISGNAGSMVSGSQCSASIEGEYYVGAVAGAAINVAVSNCSNEGSEISATSALVSGDAYYAYLGGYVGSGYSVDNCTNSSDVIYLGRGSYVGGIAGYLNKFVNECENSGKVSGYDYVGGLAGYIESPSAVSLASLVNSGEISGKLYTGGIVGAWQYNSSFVLSGASNSGAVSGSGYVGGIAGSLNYKTENLLTVSGLNNIGDVTGSDSCVGGIFGYVNGNASSTVDSCTSSADIKGLHSVGGIAGATGFMTVQNCSNTGSTVTATGFIVEGTVNSAYLGGYVGRGAQVIGCTNDSDISYLSLGIRVGGIIGYATSNVKNCTNNGNISSLGGYVGGIAGEFCRHDNRTYSGLTNTGDVSGTTHVGGIVGNVYMVNDTIGAWFEDTKKGTYAGSPYYYHKYKYVVTLSNLTNSGNITASDGRVGGIVGHMYIDSTYSWSGKCHSGSTYAPCEKISYFQMVATNFTNSGEVSGQNSVGELFGYFDADLASTLTTYTILGHVNVSGSVLEGDYATGTKYDLTVSGRVIPEVETPDAEAPDAEAAE